MSQEFSTLGAFGSDQYGVFCPYRRDVTPNGDEDPNDLEEAYTGITGYHPLTFREAVYVYWMMKNLKVSGSASYSASSSMTGDYQRIIKTRQPDGSYVLSVADQFSGTASPSSVSFNDTLKLSTGPYNQTEPVEPAKRVCRKTFGAEQDSIYGSFTPFIDNNVHYVTEMKENPNDDEEDSITGNAIFPRIHAGTSGTAGLYYYYGYYVNDRINVRVSCPPIANFFQMYAYGEFVGYGFESLVNFDIHVSASGNGRVPLSHSLAQGISANVFGGGFGGISSIEHTDKFSQWEGTKVSNTVNFGGFNFFATAFGGPINIGSSGGNVTLSYSDSDSDSNTYDVDTRDDDGAGIVYTGEGECEAEAAFNITIKAPTYWEYPD